MEISSMVLLILSIIVVICLWIVVWDSNRFIIKKYQIFSNKLQKPCRFIFLSDLHNKEYGENNIRLMQSIDAASPDFIVVGGDMINAKPKEKKNGKAVNLVKMLADKYQIYYAYGNHEYRARLKPEKYKTLFQSYMDQVTLPNVHFLDNKTIKIDEFGIYITGFSMEHYYYKKRIQRLFPKNYMKELIGTRTEEGYQILLAHNPEFFEEYAKWNPDLVLSGHVHGGVGRIPLIGGAISPSFHPFPHYDGGLFQEFGHEMILSRGLGMHTIPLRFLNPGELIIVELNVAKTSENS